MLVKREMQGQPLEFNGVELNGIPGYVQKLADIDFIPGYYTDRAGICDVPRRLHLYQELDNNDVRAFRNDPKHWNLTTARPLCERFS